MRVGETGRCDHQILEEGTHDEKAENVGTRLSDRERERAGRECLSQL